MRIRWVNVWRPFVIVLLGTGLVALGTVFIIKSVHAVSLDWVHGTIRYSQVADQKLYSYPPQNYPSQTATLGGLDRLRPTRQAYISQYHARGMWDYGTYSYGGNEFPFVSSSGTAIHIGSDQYMYRVTPMFPHAVTDVPNSDDIIFPIDDRYSGYHFTYYRDFPSKLHQQSQPNGELSYTYDQVPDFVLRRPDGTDVRYGGSVGISQNGKWAVLDAWGVGLVRINLTNFEVKRFSTHSYQPNFGSMPADAEFTVSNDGAHAVVAGSYVENEVYDITDGCGDSITDKVSPQTPISSSCPVRDLSSLLTENYSKSLGATHMPSFDDGGGQLTLYVTSGGQKPPLWVQLTLDGYTPTPRLEYLALGDSYSSGEGDIDSDGWTTHYLGTTSGTGGCHLSSRSYPYLLRDYYHIPVDAMKSVACSGAQVVPDYDSPVNDYDGQGHRLAWLNDKHWLKNEQQSAIENFVPGEVPQLEFVKKYKPKIITLTGGGNDVGFADILAYCASPEIILGGVPVSYTCDYAKKGSRLESILYNSIDTQYTYDKMLVQAIQEASPTSRIVIIDYPSFITDGTAICGLNGGDLNSDERAMIQHAVQYMDTMLSQVAHDTDVNFVDIQDSLRGGRICEGSEYMTGLYRAGLLGDHDGAFHPNAAGHERIAETIETSGAMLSGVVPQSGASSFISGVASLMLNIVPGGSIIKSHDLPLILGANIFTGNSDVTVTAYSSQVSLGTIRTKSDGSANTTFRSDDLPVGRHVLVLQGVSPSGGSIEAYQFIEVKATDSNVGDGTSNLQDTRTSGKSYGDTVQQKPSETSSTDIKSSIKNDHHTAAVRDVPVELPRHTATIVNNKNIFAAIILICSLGIIGVAYVYKKG